MSTPEIRAIRPLSALPLLVARVLADHAHTSVATDHLALLTHLLDTGSYFHRVPRRGDGAVRDRTDPRDPVRSLRAGSIQPLGRTIRLALPLPGNQLAPVIPLSRTDPFRSGSDSRVRT